MNCIYCEKPSGEVALCRKCSSARILQCLNCGKKLHSKYGANGIFITLCENCSDKILTFGNKSIDRICRYVVSGSKVLIDQFYFNCVEYIKTNSPAGSNWVINSKIGGKDGLWTYAFFLSLVIKQWEEGGLGFYFDKSTSTKYLKHFTRIVCSQFAGVNKCNSEFIDYYKRVSDTSPAIPGNFNVAPDFATMLCVLNWALGRISSDENEGKHHHFGTEEQHEITSFVVSGSIALLPTFVETKNLMKGLASTTLSSADPLENGDLRRTQDGGFLVL